MTCRDCGHPKEVHVSLSLINSLALSHENLPNTACAWCLCPVYKPKDVKIPRPESVW